jgi:hypothetical protein
MFGALMLWRMEARKARIVENQLWVAFGIQLIGKKLLFGAARHCPLRG